MTKDSEGALRRRLYDVEHEIDDLRSLLTIMRHIERDERLRERLRSAQLDFRLQDVWAGRVQGDALRRALTTVEALAA